MHQLLITLLILISSLLVAISMPARAVDGSQGVIAIIVNKDNSAKALKLSTSNLKTIFWRKQRYWPKGLLIKPVNLQANNPIRLRFSQSVLGSLPSEQIDYWNGQYFNGIHPPHAVASEEAVIRYVSKTQGAIGYIDACKVDERAKAVLWLVNKRIQKQQPNLQCKSAN